MIERVQGLCPLVATELRPLVGADFIQTVAHLPRMAGCRWNQIRRWVRLWPCIEKGKGITMVETTILVVAGKKMPVPRFFKRVLQVAIAVALTAGVSLVMIVGNGFLVGRGASFQAGLNVWLSFIKRPDILTTMVLTAFVTVLFVYWQRSQERRAGASARPSVTAPR